jgi:uncharacterized PurR-regulated membrane protein YhhQ (DUF165 family)
MILVVMYLSSIVTANLLIGKWGTSIVIPVGFGLVAFDITSRDYLHEAWHKHLWLKMGLLIAVGSLLSWLLNTGVARIAIASFLAFGVSELIDTITYQLLRKKYYLIKVNGSNLFSAFADSAIFLTIAFGAFMPVLTIEQFCAKFFGGVLWSVLLSLVLRRKQRLLA